MWLRHWRNVSSVGNKHSEYSIYGRPPPHYLDSGHEHTNPYICFIYVAYVYIRIEWMPPGSETSLPYLNTKTYAYTMVVKP